MTVRMRLPRVRQPLIAPVAALACALSGAAHLAGQQPPPPVAPAQGVAAERPAGPYRYEPGGRRDPFVSLLSRGLDSGPAATPGKRADAPAGLAVADVMLKGIVQSRGEFVALIQGPDTKTFMVRSNDRLLDGTIKSITAQMLVIMQDVSDPLSTVKQREVRKMLRAPQEGK